MHSWLKSQFYINFNTTTGPDLFSMKAVFVVFRGTYRHTVYLYIG